MSAFPEGATPRGTDRAAIALTKILELILGATSKEGFLRVTGSQIDFRDLGDTPKSYVGESGKVVTVKTTEDGVEFKTPTVKWGDVYGTIEDQIDLINLIRNMISSMRRGGIDASTTHVYPKAEAGWIFWITSGGLIGSESFEPGDTLICINDTESGGDEVSGNWLKLNTNIPGLSTLGVLFATMANPENPAFIEIQPNGTIILRDPKNPSVNAIQFSLSPTGVASIGRLVWNNEDHTLEFPINSEVTLQLGMENVTHVVNKGGVKVLNGRVVAIKGAQGNRLSVELADVSNPAHTILGVATQDIEINGEGVVTMLGLVRGLDTSSWSEGTKLYLYGVGLLSETQPTGPDTTVAIATVVRSHAVVGSIYVNPEQARRLSQMSDVDASIAPQDGQFLMFLGGTWSPRTLTVEFPVTSVAGRFGDVELTVSDIGGISVSEPVDGEVLTFDNLTQTWKNKAPTGGSGGGVDLQTIWMNTGI